MEAAKRAGVRHLHYTAIQQIEGGKFEIPQVTRWDRKTEALLKASGLEVTSRLHMAPKGGHLSVHCC
jgi:NAD(P)H dehydrogenase (quinone)